MPPLLAAYSGNSEPVCPLAEPTLTTERIHGRGLRGGEVAHERIRLGDIDGALQVNGDVVCALDASIVHDDVGLEAGGKRPRGRRTSTTKCSYSA